MARCTISKNCGATVWRHKASRLVRGIAIVAVSAVLASPADAAELFRDDFNAALDPAVWRLPDAGPNGTGGPGSFFGRTQTRVDEYPAVQGGVARLQLDTFNPIALVPGDSFYGAEIQTIQEFDPVVHGPMGFETRARLLTGTPGGLVGAFFTWDLSSTGGSRDEIDFELLSNDIVAGDDRVLTNVFDGADFANPGDLLFISPAGFDLTAFNTYRFEWDPDRFNGFVRFYINGVLVREEFDSVPSGTGPIEGIPEVRVNFWAPDSNFADGFNANLQPVATEAENETFFYEVDYVLVETLGGGGAVCGNGTCEAGEDNSNCPADCPPPACNNNGTCESGEDCNTCPNDCISKTSGNPASHYCCGDGTCEGAEDSSNCAIDCGVGPVCGNGTCETGEDNSNCPADCPPPACNNNGTCESGEDCNSCPNDCEGVTGGPPQNRHCCGNGIVEGPEGDGRCDGNP